MACADPASVDGATLVTSSPYADNSVAIFTCTSGYVMSGDPYVTCSSGVWTGTYPSCSKIDSNTIYLNLLDNDNEKGDNVPTWLVYSIASVLLLLLVCIFGWCCHLLGCFEEGQLCDRRRALSSCTCCRLNYEDKNQCHQNCKVATIATQNGKVATIATQNGKVDTIATVNQDNQQPERKSSGTNKMTFVAAVNEVIRNNEKPAKELVWNPHARYTQPRGSIP